MSEKGVIRNPTESELEQLKSKNRPEGKIIKNKQTKSEKKEESFEKYRAAKNRFEPDAVKFTLPSRDRVVDKKFLEEDGSILVKPMTIEATTIMNKFVRNSQSSNDLSFFLRILILFKNVVDNCLKTNFSADDLSFIDIVPTFFFILSLTYKEFDINWECPFCGHVNLLKNFKTFEDVDLTFLPKDFEYPHKIVTETFKEVFHIYLEFIKASDVADILDPVNGGAISTKNIHLFVNRIEDESGNIINEVMGKEILEAMQKPELDKISDFFQSFGSFGSDLTITDNLCYCLNKKCDEYTKPQSGITFPFPVIINKVLGIQQDDK